MDATSIIQRSQLEGANRLDAEYYQPEYLEVERLVKATQHRTLGEITAVLTDYHANGSYQVLRQNVRLSDEPDFALMIRAVDLKTRNYANDVRYVSQHAYEFLKKTKILGGEIIIDKIGNAGEVYFMPEINRPVTLGMNLFALRLKRGVDPEFVYVFLNSHPGSQLMLQKTTGTVPTSIDKNSVRSILIPIPSLEFSLMIKDLVKRSLQSEKDATSYYSQAENLLLEELGLKDFKSPEDLSFVVNFSEAKFANRMDADFFQPKYEQIVSKIEENNARKMSDLVTMKKGFEPGSEAYQEEGKQFVRVSSVTKFGIEDKDEKFLDDKTYQLLKQAFEPKLGEILLTKDASPGVACVLREPVEGIISGGIFRLKTKEGIDPEYLALCINSIVGQWQVERDAGGSIIAHWRPEQIKNLLIPILPMETQQKIADLVRQSHEARKKSIELMEEAKRKVEEMIERGGEENAKESD